MPLVDMLDAEDNRPQIPGIQQLILICFASEIIEEPSPGEDFTVLDHTTQDYTFIEESGKGYFRRFNFIPKTGETDEEGQGDLGSDGFKNKVMGTLFGQREPTTKFLQKCRNRGLIIITKDNNGVQSVTGTTAIPAYLSPAKRGSQKQVGDTPGPQWQVEFSCDSPDPAYIYKGTPNITPNA